MGGTGLAGGWGKASFDSSAFKKEEKAADGEGDLVSHVISLASALLPLHRVVGKCLEPYQSVTVKTRNCLFVLAASSGPAGLFTKGTKSSSPQCKQEHLFCSVPYRHEGFPGGDQLCCKWDAKVLFLIFPASACLILHPLLQGMLQPLPKPQPGHPTTAQPLQCLVPQPLNTSYFPSLL